MPKVLATRIRVGLFEWACIRAINPHLDWPEEQTVETDIRLSHIAASPPGFTVTVKVRLDKIERRKLFFSVAGHDGMETILEGTHERFDEMKLEKHPYKTAMGRSEKGFDFLGLHFRPEGLSVAEKTIEKFLARAVRLYEQEQGEPFGSLLLGLHVRRWERWSSGVITLRVFVASFDSDINCDRKVWPVGQASTTRVAATSIR
jgi:predicted thioesterase